MATVFLVDDDQGARESLARLLRTDGVQVETYAKPMEFIETYDPNRPGCVVIDLQMSDMDGLELQRRIADLGGFHPCIFVTGAGEIGDAVAAMRDGAFDFIMKPFDGKKLVQRVQEAIEYDASVRRQRQSHAGVRERLESLTPREREVLELVLGGEPTKRIARRLDISPKTVEVHRSHIAHKMGVQSTSQLVRVVVEAKLTYPPASRRDQTPPEVE